MPRSLYLVRHGHSAEKQPAETDKLRTLTARGTREALMVGTYLHQKNSVLDALMCSTAIRALDTANYIGEALKIDTQKIIPQEELYEASTRTFFQFITQLDDDHEHVMCVAHNPAISYLAELLTGAEIGDMVSGGLCIITFSINSWKEVDQGNGELVRYVTPEMLGE